MKQEGSLELIARKLQNRYTEILTLKDAPAIKRRDIRRLNNSILIIFMSATNYTPEQWSIHQIQQLVATAKFKVMQLSIINIRTTKQSVKEEIDDKLRKFAESYQQQPKTTL